MSHRAEELGQRENERQAGLASLELRRWLAGDWSEDEAESASEAVGSAGEDENGEAGRGDERSEARESGAGAGVGVDAGAGADADADGGAGAGAAGHCPCLGTGGRVGQRRRPALAHSCRTAVHCRDASLDRGRRCICLLVRPGRPDIPGGPAGASAGNLVFLPDRRKTASNAPRDRRDCFGEAWGSCPSDCVPWPFRFLPGLLAALGCARSCTVRLLRSARQRRICKWKGSC